MSNWTFLTNHAAVLSLLAKDGQLSVAQMAVELGITQRSVYKILSQLETEGYIEKTSGKARSQYWIHNDRPLLQPGSHDSSVGHLLRMLDRWA